MKIDIILPYKEIFSNLKASAVSLTVKNSAEFSTYKKQINVYGQFTDLPFDTVKFIGIKTNKFIHLGNNNSVYLNYIKKRESLTKRIVEFHNRPYVFNKAIKLEKKNPITLHFHNDPRTMKGSITVNERKNIAENAEAVYFVSHYIKNCFIDGLNKDSNPESLTIAAKSLSILYSKLDKAQKRNVMKKNTVARRKSKLSSRLKEVTS